MPITKFGQKRMQRNLNARRGRRISIVGSAGVDKALTKLWLRICIFLFFNYGMVNFLWTLHQDEFQSSPQSYIDVIQNEKIKRTIVLANITFFLIMYFGNAFGEVDKVVEDKNIEESPLIEDEGNDLSLTTPKINVRNRKRS